MKAIQHTTGFLLVLLAALLSACASDSNNDGGTASTPDPSYKVGGSVTGLETGNSIQLTNSITPINGSMTVETIDVGADGPFTFNTLLATDTDYQVQIQTAPVNQTCAVTVGSGKIAAANVDTVSVTCLPSSAATFTIGGNVAGLAIPSDGVTLNINSGESLPVLADGSFTFIKAVPAADYEITITNPKSPAQMCSFANTTATTMVTVSNANIDTLSVKCVDVVANYAISGKVVGLVSADSLTLQIGDTNNSNIAQVNVDNATSTYAFPPLPDNTSYTISIATAAQDHQCSFPTGNSTTVALAGGDAPAADIACKQKLSALTFDDTALSACVSLLGLNLVEEVTALNCDGTGMVVTMTDLAGIEQLFNLTTLSVPNNAIPDTGLPATLTSLSKLSILNLANNMFTDAAISTLSALTALTDLDLSNPGPTQAGNAFSKVNINANLVKLNLNYNPLQAAPLTTIGNLPNLQTLQLEGTGLSSADLTTLALAGLSKLTNLNASANAIDDVTPLESMATLQTLLLKNNSTALQNVQTLKALTVATMIDLSGNPAMACTELQELITALNISGKTVVLPSIATPGQGGAGNCTGTVLPGEFLVSGVIKGLPDATNTTLTTPLILQLNGSINETITVGAGVNADTPFSFAPKVPAGNYTVSVSQQPVHPDVDLFCSVVTAASGTINANIDTVVVDCANPLVVDIIANSNTGNIYSQCISNPAPNLRVQQLGTMSAIVNGSSLNCSNKAITDLKYAQLLTHVRQLLLDDNNIADILPLTKLVELIHLSLDNNQISVLPSGTEMKKMQNIALLSMNGNLISDVSPLGDMNFSTNLISISPALFLNKNRIADVRPLATLISLTKLHLEEQAIRDSSDTIISYTLGQITDAMGNVVDDNVAKLVSLTNLSNDQFVLRSNHLISCVEFQTLYNALNTQNSDGTVNLVVIPSAIAVSTSEPNSPNNTCTWYN